MRNTQLVRAASQTLRVGITERHSLGELRDYLLALLDRVLERGAKERDKALAVSGKHRESKGRK